MSYLLDTNVISELRKPLSKADTNVVAWADQHEVDDQYASAVTYYELELGVQAIERKDPIQGNYLRTWLEERFKRVFRGRVLPLEERVAVAAATMNVPDRRPLSDSFIAATARVHNLVVVTRNVADFQNLGVLVVNPWLPTTPSSS
nr:Probable ribonuclease FitB [Streptococcus thermophilus]